MFFWLLQWLVVYALVACLALCVHLLTWIGFSFVPQLGENVRDGIGIAVAALTIFFGTGYVRALVF